MVSMTFKLKRSDLVRYSPMEEQICLVLYKQKGRAIATDILTDIVYTKLAYDKPRSAGISINAAIRSLQKKVVKNGEPFRIIKTKGAGPYPTEVKLEML